jgi:hypothetical protein
MLQRSLCARKVCTEIDDVKIGCLVGTAPSRTVATCGLAVPCRVLVRRLRGDCTKVRHQRIFI